MPVADKVRLVQFDWIGAKRLLLVRLEGIDTETAALLSFSWVGFHPQPLLGKENDILKIEISKLLESLILDRDVINPVLLGLISPAIGSRSHALIDPLRNAMNLNVQITSDCDVC